MLIVKVESAACHHVPPHARRSVACEGTARRARVPSMDSGDDRSSTAGVGPDWALDEVPCTVFVERRISR
jgi:hypothetical protein